MAICRPTKFNPSRGNPWLEVGLSLFCGIVTQVPYYFENMVTTPPCQKDGQTIEWGHALFMCECDSHHVPEVLPLNVTVAQYDELCMYHIQEVVQRTQSPLWEAYVIISETCVRLAPCLILVTLNLAMILDFRYYLLTTNLKF